MQRKQAARDDEEDADAARCEVRSRARRDELLR